MEQWEIDYEWVRVRSVVKESLGRDSLPDLNGILFLIGIQELGRWDGNFTKEEKQDLMHIAICSLLENDGFYKFTGRDADGWPHFKALRPVNIEGVKEQGDLLKVKIIEYFKNLKEDEEE